MNLVDVSDILSFFSARRGRRGSPRVGGDRFLLKILKGGGFPGGRGGRGAGRVEFGNFWEGRLIFFFGAETSTKWKYQTSKIKGHALCPQRQGGWPERIKDGKGPKRTSAKMPHLQEKTRDHRGLRTLRTLTAFQNALNPNSSKICPNNCFLGFQSG